MAKPKLALIPASQGPLVYSVLPSDGSGDFSFSRGSSATRINSQGLIETVASGDSRLDYPLIDGVVSGCPSLLLENSATNLIGYSEDFSDSSWSKNSITVESNSSISPDGSLNADKITKSASNALIRQYISTTGANTFSVYVKKGSLSWVRLYIASSTESAECWFDLENGLTGHTSGNPDDIKIVPMGNGWYRCIITKNTTNINNFRIYPSQADDNIFGTSGDIYVYGAQVEVGSYPTSYIPTNGTTVTRLAETANGAGDATTFNDSEGVLMAEISALADDSSFKLFGINSGATGNDIVILGYANVSNTLYVNTKIGSTSVITSTAISIDQKSFNKILVKYKSGSNSIYVNGFKLDSNTNTFTPTGNQLSELEFSYYTNTLQFYGKTKQIQYYNTALTDSELEELTSWESFTAMAYGQLYTID